MIVEGVFQKDNEIYDRHIVPSDWRYSAATVGMARYFDFHNLPYCIDKRKLFYKSEYVSDSEENLERYYDYIENSYFEYFPHSKILNDKEYDSETFKKELSKIFYLKEFLKDFKWDKKRYEIQKEICEIIKKNKKEIIDKVYINPISKYKYGYSSYLQPSCFRKTNLKTCRVLGYYIDPVRKIKSVSFGFTKDSYNFQDCIEFDYIPFGFTFGYNSCFINCNSSIEGLIEVNNRADAFLRKHNYMSFENIFMNEIKDEIPCPVEIIIRENGKTNTYYNIFYRECSKEIFDYIADNNLSNFDFVVNIDSRTINVLSECVNSILNMNVLDYLIEKLLQSEDYQSTNFKLIQINSKIYNYIRTSRS